MTMAQDESDALIVRSVVDLGHNLGMTIVAEGVENADALESLASFGCDVAQGYHILRPAPIAAFDSWWLAQPQAHLEFDRQPLHELPGDLDDLTTVMATTPLT
jgi:EAL domain-containing protein (putative c-di-GMP-specific phosphodiesterase class I)